MSEVTGILSAIEQVDPSAAEQLLPLVYDELRKLAAQKFAEEKPGQTLQATALVHKAYLRLVDGEKAQHWNSRGHFFAAAAEAMRRIVIEKARGKTREKHGGDWQRVDFEDLDVATSVSPDQLVALDDALARLEALDRLAGELVKLRYLPGSLSTRPPRPWAFRRQRLIGIGPTPARGCAANCWRAHSSLEFFMRRENTCPAASH